MFPSWFETLSIAFLSLGAVSALFIAADVIAHPQRMAVMNIVWPVTALFGTLAVLWAYYRYGRLATRETMQKSDSRHEELQGKKGPPFPVMVAKGALHCGSGCMIGDVAAEWLAFAMPMIAVWFGWHSIFSEKIFAVWVLDFVFAFVLGIVFQYFAIVPMQKLSPRQGLIAALKADALSLVAWQVGMYGAMAVLQFIVFPHMFGDRAPVDSPVFWFAMQIAMIAGFITSYPVNWWLISAGIKERM
ncbi:DUF4396 domain-containing protein (plasmid) [Rhizobium sp. WSM1274]|uniref:DUF4396 domain-containing protein n=1 Tax=Rhizobium sp. WSM1274 TaxID=3138254 RepID=UPI0021A8DB54|nr:DUF4396 domain-containing protein [Rhizobium leguminosarum]UWU31721.1 DUF4396 domain-containing protein [Rhizobium leguminosarum bv. viciae]